MMAWLALAAGGLIVLPYLLLLIWFLDGRNPEEMADGQKLLVQILAFIGLALIIYFPIRVYRWMANRSLRKLREEALEQALDYVEWRNTWICTTCGETTIAPKSQE
jgi:uncharacterized membrane protein